MSYESRAISASRLLLLLHVLRCPLKSTAGMQWCFPLKLTFQGAQWRVFPLKMAVPGHAAVCVKLA